MRSGVLIAVCFAVLAGAALAQPCDPGEAWWSNHEQSFEGGTVVPGLQFRLRDDHLQDVKHRAVGSVALTVRDLETQLVAVAEIPCRLDVLELEEQSIELYRCRGLAGRNGLLHVAPTRYVDFEAGRTVRARLSPVYGDLVSTNPEAYVDFCWPVVVEYSDA